MKTIEKNGTLLYRTLLRIIFRIKLFIFALKSTTIIGTYHYTCFKNQIVAYLRGRMMKINLPPWNFFIKIYSPQAFTVHAENFLPMSVLVLMVFYPNSSNPFIIAVFFNSICPILGDFLFFSCLVFEP